MNRPVSANEPGRQRPGFWLRLGLLVACWKDPRPVIDTAQLLAVVRRRIAELEAERAQLRAALEFKDQRIGQLEQWRHEGWEREDRQRQRCWFWMEMDEQSREALAELRRENFRLYRENTDLHRQLTTAGEAEPADEQPSDIVTWLPTRDHPRPPDPAA